MFTEFPLTSIDRGTKAEGKGEPSGSNDSGQG